MSLRQCSQNVIFNSFQWKKRSGRSQCVLAPARGLSVVPVLPSEQLGPAAFNATDAAACGALGAAPPVLGFSGSRVLARSPRPAAAAPRGTGAAAWERGWERGWAGGGVPGEGGHVSRVLKDEVTSGGCGDSWGALAWRQRWGGGGALGPTMSCPGPRWDLGQGVEGPAPGGWSTRPGVPRPSPGRDGVWEPAARLCPEEAAQAHGNVQCLPVSAPGCHHLCVGAERVLMPSPLGEALICVLVWFQS